METETVSPIFSNSTTKKEKMGSPIDLYYFPASPPSRLVLLVGKAVGVNFNKKVINILNGEQMTSEFLKINPQHTVPTMDDNGLVLYERAIAKYLVDQYSKDDTLAPKDPKTAALVNQRLYFDAGTLHPRIGAYFAPVMFANAEPSPEAEAKVKEALKLLDTFLENQVWAAGQYMTIADFALVVTVSTAEAVNFDLSVYPNITSWYKRCQTAMADYGYQEINKYGADMMGDFFKSKLNQ